MRNYKRGEREHYDNNIRNHKKKKYTGGNKVSCEIRTKQIKTQQTEDRV